MNLAAEMSKLPEPPSNSRPPYWDYWRHNLWTMAQIDAPDKFEKWPAVYHTMLVDHWWPYPMAREAGYVQDALRMELSTKTSDQRNIIHQLYHLLKWEEATKQRVSDQLSIFEFGGGYGAMARAARLLGFRGKYTIFDLPEFALLQQWYLWQYDVPVEHVSSLDEAPEAVDLFIACYSLSEADYSLRNQWLNRRIKNLLLLYSNRFAEFDNLDYFQAVLPVLFDGHSFIHEHVSHLPPESWYTWGYQEHGRKSTKADTSQSLRL